MYSNTPIALVAEEEMNAPFIVSCECVTDRLMRLGVINEKGDIREFSVSTLATAFASSFCDSLYETYEDDLDKIDDIFGALEELWMRKETIGSYLYVVFSCGLMEYSVPRELLWIARREYTLKAYMQKFVEMLQEFIRKDIGYPDKDGYEMPIISKKNSKEEI